MPPSAESSTRRVLIVEDEALIAEEIRERLERLRYEVVGVCDSSHDAVETALRVRPDLILMDVRLKGPIDGIDAALSIGRLMDVPVVFLTAHSDRVTVARAKQANPLGYVLKPFQERDLMVAVELALHRHELERRLKESERRYVATLASVADGVVATDDRGRVTYMNPVAQALTGWSIDDARDVPVQHVVPFLNESSGEPMPLPVDDAISQRIVVRRSSGALLICHDGSVLPADYSAAPILDDSDRVLGAVMAFRDLREKQLAETALKRAEDELRQAQKMEAIGRLAGGVAHDFNNILTLISGDVELALGHDALSPEVRVLLEEIGEAGARGAALTRQLLAFGRKQEIEPRIIDVNEFIRSSHALLGRLLGDSVSIEVELREPSGRIFIDPAQFELVVLNLAINAKDAMPDGGTLSIGTRLVEGIDEPDREGLPPGPLVLVTLADTGVGMVADLAPRIFEPFFMAKEGDLGTGLGLATVFGIVKRFGGEIKVESAPRAGTVFSLYFPIDGGG